MMWLSGMDDWSQHEIFAINNFVNYEEKHFPSSKICASMDS